MATLWNSAFLVNTAIAITLAEWLGVCLYRRLTGRGPALGLSTWNLLSGLCLMLALRSALLGQEWFWGAGGLAASGLAHLAYLGQRWRRQRRGT